MSTKIWENDLIGVLNKPEETDLSYRDSVIINKQESLQLFVRIISQPADSFPNVKVITCFYSDLERWGFEDDYHETEEIRKERVREWLTDRLFVFRVEKRIRYNHEEVYNAMDVRVMPKLPSFHDGLKLIPVPLFNEESHGLNKDEFIYRLSNKKFVGRIENISHETNDTPAFVLWREGEDEEQLTLFGDFQQHHYAHGGFSFEVRDELKMYTANPEWTEECYFSDYVPNVVFVPVEIYQMMTKSLDETGAISLKTNKSKREASSAQIPQSGQYIQETKLEAKLSQIDSLDTIKLDKSLLKIETNKLSSNQKESEFLELLYRSTMDAGLVYQKDDLINFHTSMKSSSIVILSGMSGTGKTKLVDVYSQSLGLKGDQYTAISVSPSWTSDTDLIGYADTLHMVYRPGDSGLINALRKAEDEPNKIFIILFDEMNLARVEHYFSQFLSILEMEHGKKVVRLYNDDLESRLYNSAQYPPTIVIRDNVFFVGTVNMDESTHHFSDKVLDRANVISLSVMPFHHMKDLPEKKKGITARYEEIDFETFKSFKRENRSVTLTSEELSLLWDVHCVIQQVNKQTGVGPRIVKQMDVYLENLPDQEFITREKAFDFQFVQRILTKVRGSEDQLRELIGKYDRESNVVVKSALLDLFDKYLGLSEFAASREVVKQKAKELRFNGYTM